MIELDILCTNISLISSARIISPRRRSQEAVQFDGRLHIVPAVFESWPLSILVWSRDEWTSLSLVQLLISLSIAEQKRISA